MANKKTYKKIRLILGDQLNINHSWFNKVNEDVLYVLMELKSEQTYVRHHIQKISAFFAAMRDFSDQLREKGHDLKYIKITDESSSNSFSKNLLNLAEKYQGQTIEYQIPDEYRLDLELENLKSKSYEINTYDTEHFITTREELANYFKGKKQLLLENFYQNLRKKHNILVSPKGDPEGGQWNFDKQNRNKLPKNHEVTHLRAFQNDVSDILNEIKKTNIKYFGVEEEKIKYPINREQSLILLNDFIKNGLQYFGSFQDAMHTHHWRLYHSLLSFSLNTKQISPKEVIDKTVEFYHSDKSNVDINQVEGFVRQILGWREYVRGVYWKEMPAYKNQNFLNLKGKLPKFYWDGNTKMNCLSHSINQSLDYSYAHHIQRLMVTGNFALLAGVNPDEVDDWYLGIYADAIEWVQLPNTRGMSQYADGGILGTKPYVSSANYINKMSNYCGDCYYSKSKTYGDKSCPFNSLYWNFIDQHKEKLSNNPRMGMMYSLWNKREQEEKTKILEQANDYLTNINDL